MKQEFYENTIRFPVEMRDELHKLAQQEDRSINWLVVDATRRRLQQRKRKRKEKEAQ